MKIRSGFVSNSSSTSFVIYGISMPTYKLEEWLNDHYNAMLSEENIEAMEEEGNYAIVELFADLCADWLNENNLDVYTGYESEYTYIGIVVGQHSKDNDLDVNPIKGKQQSNVRSSGADEAIKLIPPRTMSLEKLFINRHLAPTPYE